MPSLKQPFAEPIRRPHPLMWLSDWFCKRPFQTVAEKAAQCIVAFGIEMIIRMGTRAKKIGWTCPANNFCGHREDLFRFLLHEIKI